MSIKKLNKEETEFFAYIRNSFLKKKILKIKLKRIMKKKFIN